MTVHHVVYWDIDGTLLSTARAGVPALEDAAAAVLGRRPDLRSMATSGLTDRMIARRILENGGVPAEPSLVKRLLDAYGERLPARLSERRGRVLPGVVAALHALSTRGDTANALITGNIRRGAEAKLNSYGLVQYFDDVGGYAEDGEDRADIAETALRRAEARYGEAARAGVLIGDTPYDVTAGVAVGLRVVAVSDDPGARETLRSCGAWWVLEQVPSAEALVRRMSAVPASGT